MEGVGFFSRSYGEARTRFLQAASARGAAITSHENPHALGPAGDALITDCAVLGRPDAPHVLFIQSATHGVEGFCGSGCQLGLLRDSLTAKVPEHIKIVLVHALNPYGFAWVRRVNEDNVDLNRNFIDHAAPPPNNEGYEALKDAICPPDLTHATLEGANSAMRTYAQEHGFDALQSAITAGQYRYENGLYFGGRKKTWSNELFCSLVSHHGAHAQKAVLVDIHTGLGDYGAAELIVEVEADDPAYARAKAWWGDLVKSTVTGESVSARLTGTIDTVLPSLLPGAETTSTCLEFGTCSGTEVFRATRADNWLHTLGNPAGPEAKGIKDELRRVFYPDAPEWKHRIWRCSRAVAARALAGLD